MKSSSIQLDCCLLTAFDSGKKAAAISTAGKDFANFSPLIENLSQKFLIVAKSGRGITFPDDFFRRIAATAADTNAGLIYTDYREENKSGYSARLLNDYQPGSIRSDFDFGPVMVFSVPAVKRVIRKYGNLPRGLEAALYDLRLKISLLYPIIHLPELLYSVQDIKPRQSEQEKHFSYAAAANLRQQRKLEKVANNYLWQLGAYLAPRTKKVPAGKDAFPVEASIIIPVLNRRNTIAEALQSALRQQTDFSFNVLVVDNHSTDGTAAVIKKMAKADARVIHLVPERLDLGIGGCWNEAVYSRECGRFAIQLDSDDLYSSTKTLQKMVEMLRRNFAMVAGSYTIVNEKLKPIAPGLIDHREWTKANGHNNLLRVNGMGAPRAFQTSLLRKLGGFPNVSYGEDYAVALRISREYQIGRIYESLYLCRRWPQNTDAGLSAERKNSYDYYKDKLRTLELIARRNLR